MATYVISDIHGEYKKFIKILKQIAFRNEDYLLILGDNIDRGAQSAEMLEYIATHSNVDSLIGNHEQMMLDSEGMRCGAWTRNGGFSTIFNFEEYAEVKNRPNFLAEMIAFVKTWNYYKVLTINNVQYLCVHAGYSNLGIRSSEFLTSPNIDDFMKLSDKDDLLWSREEFYTAPGLSGVITVFGHTPTRHMNKNGIYSIWHDPIHRDKICIDCGAVYESRGGRLGCLRLDDMVEFYV